MKKIYIIILNYNGFSDTKKCLTTLHLLEDKTYKLKTYLIDNGSKKNELRKLKLFLNNSANKRNFKLKNIQLIENRKNLGFAKGNNVGVRRALREGADFILLLNNDTEVKMNFLKNLIHLDKPISSPVVVFQEFKNKPKLMYDFGGFVNWWTGRTYHLNAYKKDLGRFKKRKYIDVEYVAGCSMFVKSDVFEKIGLLDELYFIYFEDVDFCISAKKRGFDVVVDPNSIVYHKLGGSMDRWSNRAIYRNLLGNFIFITKHLGIRRITAYVYLFILTLKIIGGKLRERGEKRQWKGAKYTYK